MSIPKISTAVLTKLSYILLLSLLCLFSTRQIGFSSDEIEDHAYGKRCVKFYQSMGQDTSYMVSDSRVTPWTGTSAMKSYGSAFFTTSAAVASLFPEAWEYDVRHLLSALLGFLLLYYSGKIARTVLGKQAQVLAIWFVFLTPVLTGFSLFDDKDLPFASFYLMALYYLIAYFKNIHQPSKQVIWGLVASIGLTIGVRVLGFFLLVYFGVGVLIAIALSGTNWQLIFKASKQVLLRSVLIGIGAYLFGILWYPYLISSDHLARLFGILTELSAYPLNTPMIFKGELVFSAKLDLFEYMSSFLLYQLPLTSLLSFFLLLPLWRKFKSRSVYFSPQGVAVWVLLVSVLLPLAIMLYKSAVIYGHIRHILFVWAPLSILASLCFSYFLRQYCDKPMWRYTVVAIVLFLGLKTFTWTVQSVPYNYLYFNELAGMFKEAGHKFDRDYHHLAFRRCYEKLKTDYQLTKDSQVTIACNSPYQLGQLVEYDFGKKHKIKIVSGGYRSFAMQNWDYAILSDMFFTPKVREVFYPYPMTVYAEKLDGVELCCLIKRDEKKDYQGVQLIQEGRFAQGIQLLEDVMKKHPNYITLAQWLAWGYSELNQIEKAAEYFNQANESQLLQPKVGRMTVGNIRFQRKEYAEAISLFESVLKQSGSLALRYKLAFSYIQTKQYNKARPVVEELLAYLPNNSQVLALQKSIP